MKIINELPWSHYATITHCATNLPDKPNDLFLPTQARPIIHAWLVNLQILAYYKSGRMVNSWEMFTNVYSNDSGGNSGSPLTDLVIALNSILHRNPLDALPNNPDTTSLENAFLDFFKDKIERIRIELT